MDTARSTTDHQLVVVLYADVYMVLFVYKDT